MNGRTIYSQFRARAERGPELTAIIEDGRRVTYAELDRMADAVMSRLCDDCHAAVGVALPRGAAQVAAMLGVLKSGAAVVAMEPGMSDSRREFMAESAGADLVLDDCGCTVPTGDGPELPDRSLPEGAALVLFTSGATGRPRGVAVCNGAVAECAASLEAELDTGPGDVMLQCSQCGDAAYIIEVFATLAAGGAVAIAPRRGMSPGALMDFAAHVGATMLCCTPYMLAGMGRLPSLPPTLRLAVSTGDVLRAVHLEGLRGRGIRIFNTYGHAETAGCAAICRVDDAASVRDGYLAAGRALPGVRLRVLDESGCEAAAWCEGEICVSAPWMPRGYLGNGTGRRRFVTSPTGARYWRSGDRGYALPDGRVVQLRADGICRRLRTRLAGLTIPAFRMAWPQIPLTRLGNVDFGALAMMLGLCITK